jgi:photosystem II stability/assembly factor-like uncharacterized protein
MSGRVSDVDVVERDPNIIYVGTATGGVWKSINGGMTWDPIFDDQPASSIGAIAVFQRNPDIVWVGTGEGNPRNSAGVGRGVFKSIDGGRTWSWLGLQDSERIHRIALHPSDPNTAYVAVMGPTWSDGQERGVYKTIDGGVTWERVLFVNQRTGAADMIMDPGNPNKLFVAMWEHRRWPWFFESGGVGSGLYLTYDGGVNWRRYDERDGMPQGPWGRIGLAISQRDPRVVYALVEAEQSSLLRSGDGGATWSTINDEPGVAPRPFYYADIRVDPVNENRLYNLHSRITVSEDQGRTFRTVVPSQIIHGDVHDLWIDARHGRTLIMGNDGGIGISYDRGETWRFVENLPLAQFYHVNVDMDIPFNVYGGLQDNGSWFGPSSSWYDGPIRNYYWTRVGGGDGFATMTDFGNSRYGYTSSQQGNLRRFDKVTGERKDIKPVHPGGTPLRFNWNAAINVDAFDSSVIYLGSQFVHRSLDNGNSWEIVSPDLTTNDPEKQRSDESGGLTRDASGAENHTTILTIAPSPVESGVLWVGTDDGNVQITRDAGETWDNVAGGMPGVPANTWVAHIEPSKFDSGTAYVALDDHRRGNWTPFAMMTTDYGATWRNLATDQIDGFVHVIEQDPVEPNLLFLGTEFAFYVSLDGGNAWQPMKHGLPTAPYRAAMVHPRDHDLVLATHGRGIFVVDDVRPLRELAADPSVIDDGFHLFVPPETTQHTVAESMTMGYRSTGHAMFGGDNRPYGALVSYVISAPAGILEIVDEDDRLVRTMNVEGPGFNRVTWSLERNDFETPSGAMGGPEVLPGSYVARLIADQDTLHAPLTIRPDPRSELSNRERMAKYNALMRVGGLLENAAVVMERASRTRDAIHAVMAVVAEQSGADAAWLRSNGESLERRLDSLSAVIAPMDGSGFGGGRSASGELRSVYGSMNSSWDAPTETQRIRIAAAETALSDGVEALNEFLEDGMAAYRERANEAGLRLIPDFPALSVPRG